MITSRKQCFSLLFIFVLLTSHAQQRLESGKVHFNYIRSEGGYYFGRVAPAVVFKSDRKFFHEVEFSQLDVRKAEVRDLDPNVSAGDYLHKQFTIGLRYQFTKYFATNTDKILLPMVGLSVFPTYTRTMVEPESPTSFKRTSNSLIASFALVPQLRINISKRLYADLALPFSFYRWGMTFQRITNPSIPIRQQRNGGFEGEGIAPREMLENFQVRAGIGIKL